MSTSSSRTLLVEAAAVPAFAVLGDAPAALLARGHNPSDVLADCLSAPIQRFSMTKPRLRAVQEEMSR